MNPNFIKMKNILCDFIEQFVPLTEDEKNVILELDVIKYFKKGTLILKQGKRTSESYFVLKGCIRVYYILDGTEKTTEFFTELEGYTPPCVLSNQPSELYVSCVEDSIIAISKPNMAEEVFKKFPKFETVCRILSEQLIVKSQTNFADFKTSSPEQRYLNLMKERPDLIQRVPQYQLASYLGIKPESLSRMRARIVGKK
ncbi:MAG: Crp/Fnr family transcriptional regulator [Bacteroidetes bacterium]|nr:Crp/Fnr family transcriptional regulator [Bacteroidota bacterium]